ncbi:MAG: ATP-binding cassette domain-containing protein [Lachnospiraceae bacterium]|nr:ATP-binding cassette domain-containing protein [Lachnospiraceae bacterium]
MNEILKTERLTKTYGKSIAVSVASLTVRQGDIYGLIGKNGAGKTTFMRMVLGLASPDSGQMELFGKTDLEQQRKHIGSLIEEPGRYPGMSARDNLEIIRRNLGVSDRAVTDDMLDYYLGLIAKYSDDEREHVKKAVSWALREIGKRDFNYNEKALLLAHEFAESDSKALKWIGKDAIKELETLVKAEGRGRLISSKSQMGKEAVASEA